MPFIMPTEGPGAPYKGWRLFFAWMGVLAVIIVVAIGYANAMNDINLKYCAGEYDTPKCDADRKAEKERAYERAKSQQ